MAGEIVPLEKSANDMRAFFKARKGGIQQALAKAGVTADRVMSALWTSAEKTPQLYRCEVRSVYKAMLLCAQSGLIPDGITQHAHLIPRMNNKRKDENGKALPSALECNLQIGYRGLLVLVRRSGHVGVVKATLVREGDKYKVFRGTEDRIEHEPLPDVVTPDGKIRPIIACYCIAKFANGQTDFEDMPISEVEALRVRAKADGPAWDTDYGEMVKKTVLRRLCKRLPQSEDMAKLLEIDAAHDTGETQQIDVPVPPADDASSAVQADATVKDTPRDPSDAEWLAAAGDAPK